MKKNPDGEGTPNSELTAFACKRVGGRKVVTGSDADNAGETGEVGVVVVAAGVIVRGRGRELVGANSDHGEGA